MKTKKALIWLTFICVLYCCISPSIALSAIESSVEKVVDAHTYMGTPNINDHFSPDSVIVTIKNQYSVLNKEWDPADFLPVEVNEIIDLRPIPSDRVGEYQKKTEFRTILELKLAHPGKESVIQAIQILQNRNDVLAAEPNFIGDVCSTIPDDTLYSQQTSYFSAINIDKVWDFTTGSSSVTVGVIDSGIYAHEDLTGNLISGNNYTSSSTSTNDTDGHGTQVAGVIGAVGNNGTGISGACWNIKLKPYKTGATSAYVISALSQAQLDGVPILNLSVSFSASISTLTSLRIAISDYSGLLICAAGNQGNDLGVTARYPSSFDLSNIISVGACDNAGNPAGYTNTGDVEVDIFAPGHVYTTSLANQYIEGDGTSVAAPLVTGVAALLKSYKPSLTTAQLKAAILDGAASKSALNGLCVTGGMLDAYGALLEVTGNLKNYDVEIGVNATDKITTMFVNLNFNSSVFFPTAYGHGSAANTYDAVGDSVAGRLTYYYSNSSKPSPGGVLGWAKLSAPQSLSPARSGLTISKVTSSPSTANAYLVSRLIGDVNNDDNINSTDVLYINQYLSGTRTLSSDQIKRGDVNFDGKVDVTDMLLLNQYNVELVRTFW